MSGLKELRVRIQTVQSTRRITSAMKMIATAKLRRAQSNALNARAYGKTLAQTVADLAALSTGADDRTSRFIKAGDRQENMLWVVLATDRGLCGGFNANLLRFVRSEAETLDYNHHQAILVGRKAVQLFAREKQIETVSRHEDFLKPAPLYSHAQQLATTILGFMSRVDHVSLVYNAYQSALTQTPCRLSLIPLTLPPAEAVFSTEPEAQALLGAFLTPMLVGLLYQAMLDTFAGEQAARRSAMDNATRNATEMIDDLTLLYNRTRQAAITKELIEIIAGAESL